MCSWRLYSHAPYAHPTTLHSFDPLDRRAHVACLRWCEEDERWHHRDQRAGASDVYSPTSFLMAVAMTITIYHQRDRKRAERRFS
ncbi:hypothetical protein IE81DRAFT_189233 [Ceraceosorus guamensis]|uniref:Uncharacterized protein n=1 Tax=Ceraceosorus guamensis TaxID=1522189 RepID=A0A316W6H7_9BASI|nr:hypothetical protein IE81DRAFT_189233 [Ceraceosorus guamensis]PWN45372.1 hypothetical protein IE81DRAFT_189233 [Ceraceosorus guamensis]